MDWTALIGPAVVAAAVSGVVSIAGMIVSNRNARALHQDKLSFDRRMAQEKLSFDKELAEHKFQLDLDMTHRKRQLELAEAVLTDFYGLPALVRSIRSPMSYQEEAKDRVKPAGESEAVGRRRDTFYVILARVEKSRKEIADLLAKRSRMEANFGKEAGEPFQLVHEAINQVIVSAQLLVQWAGDDIRDRELLRKMEGDIWFGVLDPDPVASKIDQAVAAIEGICSPIIRKAA